VATEASNGEEVAAVQIKSDETKENKGFLGFFGMMTNFLR